MLLGKYHGREDGIHTAEFPIESQFPDKEAIFHIIRYEIILTAEYPDSYGEVKTRTFFSHVCGSEIDRYTGGGEDKSRVFESTSHSFLAFLYGSIGKPDYIESWHPITDVELDIYLIS